MDGPFPITAGEDECNFGDWIFRGVMEDVGPAEFFAMLTAFQPTKRRALHNHVALASLSTLNLQLTRA